MVDPAARLADDVKVGPFSVVGPGVEIGRGTWIGPHVVINGPCRIGEDNKIYPFCSIGEAPQDKKYGGEETSLEIGDRNVIREYCTFNRGTVQGGGVTRVGNDNWVMAYVHVAHDSTVGDHTIFANNATLAGHVTIEDYVILGGAALVHQFCAIGAHSFVAMGSGIAKDVPPYLMVSGHPAKPHGLNVEGLRRRSFDSATVKALREAYRIVYRSRMTVQHAVEALDPLAQQCAEVAHFKAFVEHSSRGIVR